jgi:prolyl-tRNA editing enzyme YbaK/EbsC (Cys-tRNA(Pro) deacylase)
MPQSTRTAKEAADALGCELGQIAKSLVFKDAGSQQAVLIIASGKNRVDTGKIEQAAGIILERAQGSFVKKETGFAIGGVPPAGHLIQLRTFLDPDLLSYATIWAAAGTPDTLFCLAADRLGELTEGQWVNLAEDD